MGLRSSIATRQKQDAKRPETGREERPIRSLTPIYPVCGRTHKQ